MTTTENDREESRVQSGKSLQEINNYTELRSTSEWKWQWKWIRGIKSRIKDCQTD